MAEGGESHQRVESDPLATLPSLGGCEPPGIARPGAGSGGLPDGRDTAPPLVGEGQRLVDLGRGGDRSHNTAPLHLFLTYDSRSIQICATNFGA